MNIERSFMNVDDVASYLGISRNTIYWWVATKKIPHTKLGKLIRFSQDDIASWVRSMSREIAA